LEKFKSVVEFFRCSEVKLEFEKEQSICIDGELFEGKIFNLKLLPRALKILIPHGSAFSKDEIVAPAAFMS
jgi:diacylglycerol kinase family enzyme